MAVPADYISKERATPKPDAIFAFISGQHSCKFAVHERLP